MTLGELLTWAVVIVAAYPVARLVWKSYGPRSVKRSEAARPVVMSRPAQAAPVPPAPDLRQTAAEAETDAQAAPAPPSATLDMCKSLRAHGYSRDDARAFLKLVGYALNNNTWAAAKDEEPVSLTPIAGRPTTAVFDDEALRYEGPPQPSVRQS